MKKYVFLPALVMLAWAGFAHANVKTVVCDGCGETEYSRVAIQAAGVNDVVLVVDARNGQLRKYVVSSFEAFDGGELQTSAIRIAPTIEDWSLFEGSMDVRDLVIAGLEACGPGGIGDWMVPDFGYGWACDFHDRCYEQGGDEDDRADCDQLFYLNLRAAGAPNNLATAFYLAVRSTGWMYFNYRRNGWSSNNPLFGCNFLIVCDYTSLVEMPG